MEFSSASITCSCIFIVFRSEKELDYQPVCLQSAADTTIISDNLSDKVYFDSSGANGANAKNEKVNVGF